MKTLIYALGGGSGHQRRGRLLAQRLEGTTVVVTEASGPPETFADRLLAELRDYDQLVVDTFPAGLAHELDDRFFAGPFRTVLVARYVDRDAYEGYDELAARFDEAWLPYPADHCEWDPAPRGKPMGALTRHVGLQGEVDTLVIGDVRSAPRAWRSVLTGAVVIDRPFATLPRARRVVALACGYHLGWELAQLGLSTGFRPLQRRYDDQFRRAALLGQPLYHVHDLEAFLGDAMARG